MASPTLNMKYSQTPLCMQSNLNGQSLTPPGLKCLTGPASIKKR